MEATNNHNFDFKILEQSKSKKNLHHKATNCSITVAKVDKLLYINFIRTEVLRSLNIDYNKLKHHKEEFIFREALKVVTATKKAVCVAFNLNIENLCRYKRQLEKRNLLKQSDKKQFCKYTGRLAHYLTTNPELINSK